MSVTLRDIAERTGVSLGTVSRFINGETVRKNTREKLEKAIDDLGYEENIVTRARRTGQSMTIAVIVSEINVEFFMSIIEAMDDALRDHQYSILLCNFHRDPNLLKQRLSELRHRSIDGLVLFPSGLEGDVVSELKEFLNERKPVIVIDDKVHGLDTDSITSDNYHAAFSATEYLINHGHRRIAFLAGRKSSYVGMDRYRGCRDAFDTYDIPWDESMVRWADFSAKKGSACFNELIAAGNPPTAIFPMSYDMTMGVLLSIVNMQITIPDELSIFGFDNFAVSEAISPGLTLIEQPTERIGRLAAELLIERIQGRWKDFPRETVLKTKMVIKKSVAAIQER